MERRNSGLTRHLLDESKAPFLVVLAALLMRLAITPWAYDRIPRGDPKNYVRIAQNVIDGFGLSSGIPPVLEGSWAIFPPLYPLILSLIGLALPLTAPTFTILNWCTDIATAGAIIWVSHQLGFIRAGPIAAAAYMLWPTNLLMAPIAHKEALVALLACVIIGTLLAAARTFSVRASICFGLLSGLLALTQPALITLPVILSVALLSRFQSRREWLNTVLIAVAVATLVMLPWWIRNYLIMHRFVPLTEASGIAFWIGTMPHGSGNNWFALTPDLLAEENWHATSKAAVRQALEWIKEHPLDYLKHSGAKALYMLGPDRWDVKPLAWMLPAMTPPLAFVIVPALASVVLFAFAGIGALLCRGSAIRVIVLAGLIQLFAIQLWFEFPERHRSFLIPLLLILAVEGARQLTRKLRRDFGAAAGTV